MGYSDLPNEEYYNKIVLVKTEKALVDNAEPFDIGPTQIPQTEKFFSMHELCKVISSYIAEQIPFERFPCLLKGAKRGRGGQWINTNVIKVFPLEPWGADKIESEGAAILKPFFVPLEDCKIVGCWRWLTEEERRKFGLTHEEARDYSMPWWNEGFDPDNWKT